MFREKNQAFVLPCYECFNSRSLAVFLHNLKLKKNGSIPGLTRSPMPEKIVSLSGRRVIKNRGIFSCPGAFQNAL